MTITEKLSPRRDNLPAPGLGEHAVITGQNGSGKTETACQILLSCASTGQVIIIDTKGEERFEYLPAAIHTRPERVLKDGENAFAVYRPTPDRNNPDEIDALLLELFHQKRSFFLYIDEAYQVCPNSKPTPGYGYCLMQGRRRWDGKKTARISVFSTSQRPVWIPRHGFTEAKHFYVHSLADSDMDVMCGYIGHKAEIIAEVPPEGHEFYYYENTAQSRDGRRYPPMKFQFDLDSQYQEQEAA